MPFLTIVGSGNSAHVLAGLVHSNTDGKWQLRILTRSPDVFQNKQPTVELQDGKVRTGLISAVSNDPSKVVPGSDIVLWTGPSHASKPVFEWIAPHVDQKKTVVATIFGQGLVHILANRIFGSTVKFVALRNIPWLCRCVTRGQHAQIVGAKTSIEAATLNVSQQWLTDVMQPLFITPNGPRIDLSPDFTPIVFNPANQIIHPSAYWGLFRKWNMVQPLKELPNDGWLYRGMDEIAGQVLASLDEELQNIKDKYYEATGAAGCKLVIPLYDRILIQYTTQVADRSTMATAVGTNKAYSMAKTPHLKVDGGLVPNPNHRVVQDDIGWGLCVLVSIADRLQAPCTTMKWLIEWHQKFMKKEFIVNGELKGKDCNELVLLAPDEPLSLVAGLQQVRSKL